MVAILLFLFVARRQAAGKLVECGECGNLIPEDATVCPKCGAEFETDLIRCSRCASTIPADSKFCPECAAQLLGTPGEAESDPEKQAYADFTEKYRAEAKKELGDNYSEGAFWDWWKRQPTYTPFSQWSLQQGQGTARAGHDRAPGRHADHARVGRRPNASEGRRLNPLRGDRGRFGPHHVGRGTTHDVRRGTSAGGWRGGPQGVPQLRQGDTRPSTSSVRSATR